MAELLPKEFQGIKIVDEGKQVVRPDILQFLMQAAQVSQLVKLRKLEESKIPTGTKSLPNALTISTTITRVKLSPPWISFSLVNDGPDRIKCEVNKEENILDATYINKNASYNLNMEYPVIHTIYLQAEPEGTASVRIKGKL